VSQASRTQERLIATYRKKAKHYDITCRLYPAPGYPQRTQRLRAVQALGLIPPGPSCSSEPRSSLPGPAALDPPVYDRRAAAGATDVMRYTTFLAIGAAIVALVLSAFGEPECKLMGVEHQWAAQRSLTAPPTSYTVTGPSSDPWLAAAGLAPGDVIPAVVGYEWGSFIPGCFAGQVVPLMTALIPGSAI